MTATLNAVASARAARIVREIAETRLYHPVDIDAATDATLRAWTAGDARVEGIDQPGKPPRPLEVAQIALDRIRTGGQDPAVEAERQIVGASGVRPMRVDVTDRGVAILSMIDGEDAWRLVAEIGAQQTTLGTYAHLRRWATVEAYEDRWSPATWRVLLGVEHRSGKGR